MQVIQAVFGCIGVIFMILGALLMMRKSPRLNEAFDAAAQARGCESEHQACYEVALFCLEAAFPLWRRMWQPFPLLWGLLLCLLSV